MSNGTSNGVRLDAVLPVQPAPVRSSGVTFEVLLAGAELVLRGRLDGHSASAARDALQREVDRGVGDLVVHLDDVEVPDASGLGVLVGVDRRARLAHRRLVLVGVPARLERLIRHTRLHRVLVRGEGSLLA